jgi:hypothetical protein
MHSRRKPSKGGLKFLANFFEGVLEDVRNMVEGAYHCCVLLRDFYKNTPLPPPFYKFIDLDLKAHRSAINNGFLE